MWLVAFCRSPLVSGDDLTRRRRICASTWSVPHGHAEAEQHGCAGHLSLCAGNLHEHECLPAYKLSYQQIPLAGQAIAVHGRRPWRGLCSSPTGPIRQPRHPTPTPERRWPPSSSSYSSSRPPSPRSSCLSAPAARTPVHGSSAGRPPWRRRRSRRTVVAGTSSCSPASAASASRRPRWPRWSLGTGARRRRVAGAAATTTTTTWPPTATAPRTRRRCGRRPSSWATSAARSSSPATSPTIPTATRCCLSRRRSTRATIRRPRVSFLRARVAYVQLTVWFACVRDWSVNSYVICSGTS